MFVELETCINDYLDPAVAQAALQQLQTGDPVPLYHEVISVLERSMWQPQLSTEQLLRYQALCVELEQYLSNKSDDERFHFYIIIPVADRPQHLASCINSLCSCAEAFQYGGKDNGRFSRLTLIIADDSDEAANIAFNERLAIETDAAGFSTIYFGIEQQLAELANLSSDSRAGLINIIGNLPKDNFAHKGASLMRNITYLMLRRLAMEKTHSLFFFIDSDQEFHTDTQAQQPQSTTNYFYHLNRIFQENSVQVFTGKVVGDPPVSPAVMAGTFLDDVLGFINEVAGQPFENECDFHQSGELSDAAAYHDMAKLFGFEHEGQAYRYRCPLQTEHRQLDCVLSFAQQLAHFFDGAHPTRSTPYLHHDISGSVTSARTIYTGNYVLSAQALKYFIPFANLKLRMAGPTLGRIIQAEIGENFVSANLPMMHKRTVEHTGRAEFRPGVDHSAKTVDLSGEYERQYFGDVMLFSVIELAKQGFPQSVPEKDVLLACVLETERKIYLQYRDTRNRVMTKLTHLASCLEKTSSWWGKDPRLQQSRLLFDAFVDNIEKNFSPRSPASQIIESKANRQRQCVAITEALLAYQTDRLAWGREKGHSII